MIVGRVIGWIVVLAGLSVLIRDILAWLDTKTWSPVALGQLWYEIDRSSLDLVQAVIQRDLSPFLLDPVVANLLLCWAFVVLIAVGSVALVLFRKRPRRRF